MSNNLTFTKIFIKKYNKFNPKRLNYNDNIQVKALKATPSGFLPSGWTQDIRNRMVREYNQNDFQFLKI